MITQLNNMKFQLHDDQTAHGVRHVAFVLASFHKVNFHYKKIFFSIIIFWICFCRGSSTVHAKRQASSTIKSISTGMASRHIKKYNNINKIPSAATATTQYCSISQKRTSNSHNKATASSSCHDKSRRGA